MIQFRTLLESLHRHELTFVIVEGIAATRAGRPKDFEAIAELEAIREERRSSS